MEYDTLLVLKEVPEDIGREKAVHGAEVDEYVCRLEGVDRAEVDGSACRLEGVDLIVLTGGVATTGPVVFMKKVEIIERSEDEAKVPMLEEDWGKSGH